MKPQDFPTEPAHLWQHFYQITQTPRPSGEEAALREHIIALADQHDCSWRTDAGGNLVVYVPGSEGREEDPAVIIQNHLDMVTVKTDDKQHDFSLDPLQLRVDDGWLSADRTTLGADNGLGCAAAMALLTDEALQHSGPLGGIHAALSATEAELNLIVGCDMPYLSQEFLELLVHIGGETDADGVVPTSAEFGYEPLCAVYKRSCLAPMGRALQAGRRRVSEVFAELRLRWVPPEEWQRCDPAGRLFRNLNTREEYERARRELLGEPPNRPAAPGLRQDRTGRR